MPPVNFLGDFAGGSVSAVMGIALALLEREKSGRGQVIDANVTEGAAYLSSFIWKLASLPGGARLCSRSPPVDRAGAASRSALRLMP